MIRPILKVCCVTAAVAVACASERGLSPAQHKLMREQAQELVQIRQQIMQQLVNMNRLKDGTVYFKVKVLEKPDKKYTYTVEKISTEKPAEATDKNKGVIFLEGNVTADNESENKFKLDLKYLMPPDKKDVADK